MSKINKLLEGTYGVTVYIIIIIIIGIYGCFRILLPKAKTQLEFTQSVQTELTEGDIVSVVECDIITGTVVHAYICGTKHDVRFFDNNLQQETVTMNKYELRKIKCLR